MADVVPGRCTLDLVVHRSATLKTDDITILQALAVEITAPRGMTRELTVDTNDGDRYAVLGRLTKGSCRFDRVSIDALPAS